MAIEALWSAVLADGESDHSAGVVAFHRGHIFGGDANYHYQGQYRVAHGQIGLTLVATHFHGGPSVIAGDRDTFTLELAGETGEREMALSGQLEDDPTVKVALRLTRVAELPDSDVDVAPT
jgi:hypothetical protein